MSRKRSRVPDEVPEASAVTDRLRQLADIEYDRGQIDALLRQYRLGQAKAADDSPMVCCPRAYEESFLREPVGSERPCSRATECEGMHLLCDDPFILREFIYPGGESSTTRALCLLCRRDEISRAYYRYETGQRQETDHVRITDHYNLVGVPGEYDVRDCIVSSGKFSGIPLPVVLHMRSAYTAQMKDGVKCLSQTRMRYPDGSNDTPGSFLARRATLVKKVALSKMLPVVKLSS